MASPHSLLAVTVFFPPCFSTRRTTLIHMGLVGVCSSTPAALQYLLVLFISGIFTPRNASQIHFRKLHLLCMTVPLTGLGQLAYCGCSFCGCGIASMVLMTTVCRASFLEFQCCSCLCLRSKDGSPAPASQGHQWLMGFILLSASSRSAGSCLRLIIVFLLSTTSFGEPWCRLSAYAAQ